MKNSEIQTSEQTKKVLLLRLEFLENAIEDAIDRLTQGKTLREALLQEIPEDDEIFVLEGYLHRARAKLCQISTRGAD